MSSFNPYAYNPFMAGQNAYNPYASNAQFFPNTFASSLAQPPMVTGAPLGVGMPTGGPNIAGLVGIQDPATSLMLNMVMQPILTSQLGPNFIPAQYKPTTNLYNQMQAQYEFGQHQQTLATASKADRRLIEQSIRGIGQGILGSNFGPREQEGARKVSEFVSQALPMLTPMMGDQLERTFGGSTGFATLMAQNMFMGGRYSTDPVTGRRGLTAESAGYMSQAVFNRLYGPGAKVEDMGGITAGRAGQMYDEMQRRGLMGGAAPRTEGIRKLSENLNMTIEDVRKMPDLDTKLRELDAARVADKLKGMSKAVSAMSEIFGEMGEPDAPMGTLISAVETLTQGNIRGMDPVQAEKMVRETANVAKAAGIGFPEAMRQMGVVASITDRAGVHRAFVPEISNRALMESEASRRMFGDVRAFGLASPEKQLYMRQQMTTLAHRDTKVQNMAMIARIVEQYKVDPKKGSDLERLYKVATGQIKATEQDTALLMQISSQPGGFDAFLRNQGVSSAIRTTVQSTREGNAEIISKYNLGTTIGTSTTQATVAGRLTSELTAVGGRFAKDTEATKGVSPKLAEYLSKNNKQVSAAIAKALTTASKQDIENPLGLIRRTLETLVRSKGITELTAKDKEYLDALAGGYQDYAKNFAARRMKGTLQDMMILLNTGVKEEAAFTAADVEQTGRMQSLLAGVGKGTMAQRMVDLISKADGKTTFKDAIAAMVGAQNKDVVLKALGPELAELEKAAKTLNSTDPNLPRDKQIEAKSKAFETIKRILGSDKIKDLDKYIPKEKGAAEKAVAQQLTAGTSAAQIADKFEKFRNERMEDINLIEELRDPNKAEAAKKALNEGKIADIKKKIDEEKDPVARRALVERLSRLESLRDSSKDQLQEKLYASRREIKDSYFYEQDEVRSNKDKLQAKPPETTPASPVDQVRDNVSRATSAAQPIEAKKDFWDESIGGVQDLLKRYDSEPDTVSDLVMRPGDTASESMFVDTAFGEGTKGRAPTAATAAKMAAGAQMKAPEQKASAGPIEVSLVKSTKLQVEGKIELESKEASMSMTAVPAVGST